MISFAGYSLLRRRLISNVRPAATSSITPAASGQNPGPPVGGSGGTGGTGGTGGGGGSGGTGGTGGTGGEGGSGGSYTFVTMQVTAPPAGTSISAGVRTGVSVPS